MSGANNPPAASSFLAAMNQLNLQHPPTQAGGHTYAPLVPNAAATAQTTNNATVPPPNPPLPQTVPQNAPHNAAPPPALPLATPPALPSPHHALPHALVQTPPQAPPPGQPAAPVPYSFGLERAALLAIATDRYRRLMTTWKPRYLAPNLRALQLRKTREKIAEINLVAHERDNPPYRRPLQEIDRQLFLARADYLITFPRIFRIEDLPTEITMNIFRYACWASLDARDNLKTRIRISVVSRHWRTIVIADTTLWNSIYFRTRASDERGFAFLERAGYGPIDIRIDDSRDDPLTAETAKNILDKVFTKLSSLRIMVMSVQGWDGIIGVFEGLRRVADENIPMIMERLEIHRIGSPYVDVEPRHRPIPLFGGATVPSFNWLTLNGAHINWKGSDLSTLTTLDLRRVAMGRVPTAATFRSMLQTTAGLEKLIIDGAGPAWDKGAVTLSPIAIPTLKTLVIGGLSDDYGVYVLSQFTCPNVLDLTVLGVIGNECEKFITMLTSKTPKVKLLSLYNLLITQSNDVPLVPQIRIALGRWLKSMPDVAFLRIGRTPVNVWDIFSTDQEALQRVGLPSAPRPTTLICPKLTCLDFHLPYNDDMVKWVALRKRVGYPLKKVYILRQHMEPMTREQTEKLKTAVEPFGKVGVNDVGSILEEETILLA